MEVDLLKRRYHFLSLNGRGTFTFLVVKQIELHETMQKPAKDVEKGLDRDRGSNEKDTCFLTRIRRWSSWGSEADEPNTDVTPKRSECTGNRPWRARVCL